MPVIRTNKNEIFRDLTGDVGDKLLQENLTIKSMENGIGKLDWENVKSTIVYALLSGLLIILLRISSNGGLSGIDWEEVLNAGIVAAIAAAISVVKNLLTTNKGNFLGVVKTVSKPE